MEHGGAIVSHAIRKIDRIRIVDIRSVVAAILITDIIDSILKLICDSPRNGTIVATIKVLAITIGRTIHKGAVATNDGFKTNEANENLVKILAVREEDRHSAFHHRQNNLIDDNPIKVTKEVGIISGVR